MRLRFRPKEAGLDLVGTEYGGWRVPLDQVDASWVCYTAGVGEDVTFDVALAEIGCDVVAIDPTPRAIEFAAPFQRMYPNLRLAPYAVWNEDGTVAFYPPRNPEHVSFSATNRQGTSAPTRVPARTITSIAAEFRHDRVDLLKLDIEGAEYGVLADVDLRALGVRILCVEYHDDHGWPRMLGAVRSVEKQGYRVAAISGTDVTFLRE